MKKTSIQEEIVDLRSYKLPNDDESSENLRADENIGMNFANADKETPMGSADSGWTESSFDQFQNGKWAKAGRFFLYMLIFLLPLFFLPLTVSFLAINKQVLAIILVSFSFISYAANVISTKRIVYPNSLLAISVFIIFAIYVNSSFFSQAMTVSLYGYLIQPDSLISVTVYALAFFAAASLFQKKNFNSVATAFIAGLILACGFGLLQISNKYILPFDFAKQSGFNTVGSPFDFGLYAAFGLAMIIGFLSEFKTSLVSKSISIIAALLAIVLLFALNIRIIWLIVSIVMLILVAYKFTSNIDKKKKDGAVKAQPIGVNIPLVAMIISFLFVLISPSLPSMANFPVEIKPNLSSTVNVAKENATIYKNILVGSGPATFGLNYTLYRPTELNMTNVWSLRFNQGYSFLSTIPSTMGILGLLSFLFLIYCLIFKFVKNFADKKVFVIGLGLLLYVSGWIFHQPYLIQFIFIFLGLGLLSSFSSSFAEVSLENTSKGKSFALFFAITMSITGGLAFVYSVGQKYAGAVYYQKGIASTKIEDSLINLDRASILDPDSDQYHRALSQALILDAQSQKLDNEKDASSREKINSRVQNDIALAVQIAQKATVINPSDSMNWSNLAGIYEGISSVVEGSDMFTENNYKEAIKRDPKNHELHLQLANAIIAAADRAKAKNAQNSSSDSDDKKIPQDAAWNKKIDEAYSYLKKSIDLKSDYIPAHLQVALVYLRKDDTQKMNEKLEEIKKMTPLDSVLAFQVGTIYLNSNQIEDAQKELERAVALNENYANARYNLGLVYDKQNKKDKAIEQFEKVLKLNPESEEVKKILANLKAGIVAGADTSAEKENVNNSEGLNQGSSEKLSGETSENGGNISGESSQPELAAPKEENKTENFKGSPTPSPTSQENADDKNGMNKIQGNNNINQKENR